MMNGVLTPRLSKCQVVRDPLQFNYFLEVCEKGAKEWGNAFTYTLLTQGDLE